MNLDEIKKSLSKDGCWWFDPWWDMDHWYGSIPLTKSDILTAVDFLKTIFPDDWVKSLGENCLDHPFLQLIFFGKGLSQLCGIYELAVRYQAVIQMDGSKSVLAAYKTIEHSQSADFEVFFLHALTKDGFDVSFITAKPKLGKTPDILARILGKEFVVECKCIRESFSERWVTNYGNSFGNLIMDAAPEGCCVLYFPAQSTINPRDYGDLECSSYQLAAMIDTLPIVNYLKMTGPFSPQYRYINFGVKGHVYIFPKRIGFSNQSYIPEISSEFVGARLVKNAIQKASSQISAFGKPGIAAIFYDSPPDTGLLKLELPKIFKKYKEDYALLMGVIIFPAQNILSYVRPIWIANHFASNAAEDYGLPSSLMRVFNPII